MRAESQIHERLRLLARFLPEFESLPTQTEDLEGAFIRTAYDSGCVLDYFDWPGWKDTEEATALVCDEAALASATSEQLAKLLTTLIRKQRFIWGGSLVNEPERRLILGILRRAAVLARK